LYKNLILVIALLLVCGGNAVFWYLDPIPEPAGMFMLGSGLLGFGVWGRTQVRD
jgi:hypothetical protein